MTYFPMPEVWLVATGVFGIAACVLSWMLGEARGIAQAERRRDEGSEEVDALFPLTVPAKADGYERSFSQDPIRASRPILGSIQDLQSEVGEAESARRARNNCSETFANMPPLEELRAQVEEIRRTDRIWESRDVSQQLAVFKSLAEPDMLDLMQTYRASIRALSALEDASIEASQREGSESEERKAATPISGTLEPVL